MIKRLRVINFKSLADVNVELAPTTVLIGRSGSGKTNFIEAIRCLKSLLIYGTPSTYFNIQGGPTKVLTASRNDAVFGFEVDFSVQGLSDNLKYKVVFNIDGKSEQRNVGKLREESLSDGTEVVFAQKDGVILRRPYENAPMVAHSMSLGRITGSESSTFSHVALTQGLACIDIRPTVFRDQPSNETDGMNENATNILAVIKETVNNLSSLKNWQSIVLALRGLNQSVRTIEVSMPGRDRVLVSHGNNGKLLAFDVRDESEGFRRFMAHLVTLYQTPKKQTICFEEPENGIHPGALEILADEFKKCPTDDRGQVIVTTHSPQFLDHFPPESIRVVQLNNLETTIGSVSAEQLALIKRRLLSPGELLTVDPARIDSPPTTAVA